MIDTQRITELTVKYKAGTLTETEKVELDQWLDADENRRRLWEIRTDDEETLKGLPVLYEAANFKEKEFSRFGITAKEQPGSVEKKPVFKKRILLYAGMAAAIVSAVAIVWDLAGPAPQGQIAKQNKRGGDDIKPGGMKAVLTLADGQRVVLDSAQAGDIGNQGGTLITKLDSGQITYRSVTGLSSTSPVITYNTLETPPAGQYRVILPDGTKVWLNNASSLKYPTVFAGKIRQVELSGEGFFQVARDPQHPFHVVVGGLDVAVVGTSFNIMAYSNETSINTTLVDGAVKISQSGKQALLVPGEQVQLDKQGAMKKMTVNTGSVISWTNGFFNFSHTDFQAALRQLARWYDIDIVYKGAIPHQSFSGVIDRQASLSQVLKIFESDEFHLTIEGNRLIVSMNEK